MLWLAPLLLVSAHQAAQSPEASSHASSQVPSDKETNHSSSPQPAAAPEAVQPPVVPPAPSTQFYGIPDSTFETTAADIKVRGATAAPAHSLEQADGVNFRVACTAACIQCFTLEARAA